MSAFLTSFSATKGEASAMISSKTVGVNLLNEVLCLCVLSGQLEPEVKRSKGETERK